MSESVKLLFFGLLRDIMGKKQFEVTIEKGQSLDTFLTYLTGSFDSFKKIYGFIMDQDQKQPVVIMVNGITVGKPYNAVIQPGFEVAFLPPVGGG